MAAWTEAHEQFFRDASVWYVPDALLDVSDVAPTKTHVEPMFWGLRVTPNKIGELYTVSEDAASRES